MNHFKTTFKRANDGVGWVEVANTDPEGHYMVCTVCGGDIDLRCLDQVAFHETHQPAPDIQYSGSMKTHPASENTTKTKKNMTLKTIKYYSKNVYGNQLDYVADPGDAKIMAQLTGRKTITGVERELVYDLTGGLVQWEQVIEPAKS